MPKKKRATILVVFQKNNRYNQNRVTVKPKRDMIFPVPIKDLLFSELPTPFSLLLLCPNISSNLTHEIQPFLHQFPITQTPPNTNSSKIFHL